MVQHKSSIRKVMLLVMVGWPHHRLDGIFSMASLGSGYILASGTAQHISKNRTTKSEELSVLASVKWPWT